VTAPRGIRRAGAGWRVWQRVHPGAGGLKSKRFPATATLTEMRQWREDQRVAHRKAPAPKAERGTLEADIATYLKLVATMPSFRDRKRDLDAWVAAYGMRPRLALTRADYQLQLQAWRQRGGKNGTPLAASTVNHRRTALMHVYSVLDGRAAPNPLRDIPAFPEPPPEPRAVPLRDIRAIVNAMAKTKTRARLKVLMWTGVRGRSELGKMKPEHVDLRRKTCWVPTGKHGRPRQLMLNAEGVKAWREFIALDAWGEYSKDSLRRTFLRALAAVNKKRVKAKRDPLPAMRPYDLRHSIATALRRAGADLADIQDFLGHSSPRMTRRYAPYDAAKLKRSINRLR
jgi:integrase